MNDQILVEIRDSLREIKALASPVMVMNADAFTPEQEQDLKDSLSKIRGGLFVSNQPAEALALKQKLMSGLNADREVFDIVHAINVLAMANADVIHVFTEFAPHINQFCVNVYGVSQDYITNPSTKPLMQELVFLADNEALEKILSVESQLTELIIEAREEAEAKAEVTA
ncbi:hypothetical protein AB6D63_02835 [Vibrio splendidus]